jgi:hypothetical protein
MDTSYAQSIEVLRHLARSCNTPFSRHVLQTVENKGPGGLAEIAFHPSKYTNPTKYSRDALVYNLLRKIEAPDADTLRKEAALASYWKCEVRCLEVNRQFMSYTNGFFKTPAELRNFDALARAKDWIRSVIGDSPRIDELNIKFGPGIAIGTSRYHTAADKLDQKHPSITLEALNFFEKQLLEGAWFRTMYSDGRRPIPSIVPGSRFACVPKDITKDRGIAVEPLINGAIQLALGAQLRNRLNKVGLLHTTGLLEAQTSHKSYAEWASSRRDYATLDLSSASDSVALELVRFLLPDNWFKALFACRSHSIQINGEMYRCSKFSSMGNGYTFELETLIFASLCACWANRGYYSVYGDDIIVKTEVATNVIELLEFCGFSLNKNKSFWGSHEPFRESCGGDFFNGVSVRPYHMKREPREPADWFAIHNGLQRWALQERGNEKMVQKAINYILEQIPSHLRTLKGPSHLGDTVLVDESALPIERNGFLKWKVLVPLTQKLVPWDYYPDHVRLVYNLMYPGSACDLTARDLGLSPRGEIKGYKVKSIFYADGGTWFCKPPIKL